MAVSGVMLAISAVCQKNRHAHDALMRTNITFSASITEGRKFAGVAYSGGVIPAYGPYGDVAIDLATASITPKAFALLDHDPKARAGVAEFSRVGNEIHVSGHLLDNPHGNEIAAVASQGGPWQLSVGITAVASKAKSPATINGQSVDVQHIFTDAIIREVSFVTAGADPNTSVQVFSAQDKERELEIVQLRQEQIMARYPHATPEQAALIGALPRQVFEVVMALAKTQAKPQQSKLSALVSPSGGQKAMGPVPDGVDPERHDIAVKAHELVASQKISFQEALKQVMESRNAHSA